MRLTSLDVFRGITIAGMILVISIYNWIYQNILASWAGNANGSFLFALFTLLFWYGVAVLMYQKRWFIKV